MWAFKTKSFNSVMILLLILWVFFESYRLYKGYKSNITESFPDLITFDLMTIVFSIPPQILIIAGHQILPVERATLIIYLCFAFLELITSIFVMNRIIKRKAAVYFLHNTATEKNVIQANTVKTSNEIMEEVYLMYGIENDDEKFHLAY